MGGQEGIEGLEYFPYEKLRDLELLIHRESGLGVGHRSGQKHPVRAAQARPSPVVPRNRTRGNGCRFKHSKLHIRKRLFCSDFVRFVFCESGQTVCLESCGVAILGDLHNLTGHNPKQPALGECILILD